MTQTSASRSVLVQEASEECPVFKRVPVVYLPVLERAVFLARGWNMTPSWRISCLCHCYHVDDSEQPQLWSPFLWKLLILTLHFLGPLTIHMSNVKLISLYQTWTQNCLLDLPPHKSLSTSSWVCSTFMAPLLHPEFFVFSLLFCLLFCVCYKRNRHTPPPPPPTGWLVNPVLRRISCCVLTSAQSDIIQSFYPEREKKCKKPGASHSDICVLT